MLRDTDGDGVPDKVTIFAEGLVLRTGVMRWKRGILVSRLTRHLVLRRRYGDGKADIKRKVLTGFPFTNPRHTANGLIYGLDNWIYIAHEHPATAVLFKEEFGDPGSESSTQIARVGHPCIRRPPGPGHGSKPT